MLPQSLNKRKTLGQGVFQQKSNPIQSCGKDIVDRLGIQKKQDKTPIDRNTVTS